MKPGDEAKAPSLSSDRRIDESGRSKKGFKASFLMPREGGGGLTHAGGGGIEEDGVVNPFP